MREMLADSNRDVTTINDDLKLSTLKPLHVITLTKICHFFKTADGKAVIKSGFRATGITGVV